MKTEHRRPGHTTSLHSSLNMVRFDRARVENLSAGILFLYPIIVDFRTSRGRTNSFYYSFLEVMMRMLFIK